MVYNSVFSTGLCLLRFIDLSIDWSELPCFIVVVVAADQPTSAALNHVDGTTGWELALVTAPSSNESAAAASKLVLDLFSPSSFSLEVFRFFLSFNSSCQMLWLSSLSLTPTYPCMHIDTCELHCSASKCFFAVPLMTDRSSTFSWYLRRIPSFSFDIETRRED